MIAANINVSPGVKLAVLTFLALQNSGITLVTRYSRGVLHEQYAVITTVISAEVIKLIVSMLMIAKSLDWNVTKAAHRVIHDIRCSAPAAVPGLLYLIQNKLTYVGLQNLDGASYSMLSQFKLLTTAFFSVLLLRKKLYFYQWRALLLLFIGVVLIQVRPTDSKKTTADPHGDVWVGTVATFGVTVLSGLVGIYNEYILKSNAGNFSMWDTNVQLSLYGVVFGLFSIPLTTADFAFFQVHSFFYGWTWWTVGVVILASLGGLLVSMAVLYTDNILKNFATSAAILLTSLISYTIFGDLQPDTYFICGTAAVLLAVFNYNEDVKGLAKSLGMTESVLQTVTSSLTNSSNSNSNSGNSNDNPIKHKSVQSDDLSEEDDERGVELKPMTGISINNR